MLKEKVSKILIKVLYILFAVIIAITLWVYVEITENEIRVDEVPNIGIVFINMDLLRDRGFSLTSFSPDTLTIRFEAPRSEMARLATTGALTAEVDLASITSTGTHVLAYRLVYPSNVNMNTISYLGASENRIIVTVDMELARQIPVEVDYRGGTASESLLQENAEPDPLSITVRGPERIVSRIRYARVPIFRENLATTVIDDFPFILIDVDGDVIDDEDRSLLELSQETIRVTIPITEVKEIPLFVNLMHGSSTSEQNANWRAEPAYIIVSGDPIAIGNINSIQLGTIDMTDFGLTYTHTFPIIIPDHLTNISGITLATVHVDVIGLDIAFLITSNLHVTNPPPGHQVEIMTQSVDVRLRGRSEDLATVSPLNLRVVADLTDRSPGTQRVPARVYIDGIDADIDPVGSYFLTVTISVDEDD